MLRLGKTSLNLGDKKSLHNAKETQKYKFK